MVKPWPYIRELLSRNSSQEKGAQGVSGYKLDIDVRLPENEEGKEQRWRRVSAVYIPTSGQDLLRQDVAAAMGLDTIEGAVADICWRLSTEPYKYSNKFHIRLELPYEVVFGRQSALNCIQKYPNTFEKGKKCQIKHDFGEFNDVPKHRTNSWGRLKETLSWNSSGSNERKDKPRRLSFLQRKSQTSPDTRTSDTTAREQEVDHQNTIDNSKDSNVEHSEPQYVQSKSTARLGAEHRNGSGNGNENRTSEIFGSDDSVKDISGFKGDPSETKIKEELSNPDSVQHGICAKCENPRECRRKVLDMEPTPPRQKTTHYQRSLKGEDGAVADLAPLLVGNAEDNATLTKSIKSAESSRDHETPGFSAHPQDVEPEFSNRHASGSRHVEKTQPSQLTIATDSQGADSNLSHGRVLNLERHTEQRNVEEIRLEKDDMSEPSTRYTASSLQTALNTSIPPESPLSRGNMMSMMERYPERALNNTFENDLSRGSGKDVTTQKIVPPEGANGSDKLLMQQEARAKIRARKRGKAPKIRRAKLDPSKASENVDLTPVREDWTYDSSAKGHYQIDSDTGSTIWFSDTESEHSDA